MSHRKEQVASVIMREVQRVLSQGLSDPRLAPIITVTKVEVSRDLRDATVFITALPQDKLKITIHGLRAASRHIRHRISDKVALAKTPSLHFRQDTGAMNQAGVLSALAELDSDTNEHEQTVPEGDDDTPIAEDERHTETES